MTRVPLLIRKRNFLVFRWLVCFLFFYGCAGKEPQIRELGTLVVSEGFTIDEAVSPDMLSYPMFASFDDRGRLFVFESTEPNIMGTKAMLEEPSYHIRLLEDEDEDGVFDKSTLFAENIPLPMGGSFYQGSLYIAAPPNLERLTDTDGDGVADLREVILTGWTLNSNAATLSGPFIGPDGWFYMADARRGFEIQRKEGDILKGKGARIWRSRADGTELESYAGGGFDNSIELVFTPSGETIGTMTYFTDPQDGQRDALMHWVEGGVYPKPNQVIQDDQLKLTGELMPVMTKLPRVAPSGLMRYRGNAFGDDFEGNLFSAEFNTGRIMRHIMKDAGATFSTEDEPFVTSTSSDTHPTDVLQDADGSLLVVVTGGWFIEGCPLSRVAKPDVKGGIYRVRKVDSPQMDSPQMDDPRGLDLDLEEMSGETLVQYLSDPRFAVNDRAIEVLVNKGEEAVEPLINALNSAEEDVRTAAVFALYRINSEATAKAIISALADQSATVRTAAARVLGLMKEKDAVDPLMELVRKEQPSVRRQAATALGQIGDTQAIEALLEASVETEDRFVEHSIIHALTLLSTPAPLLDALNHSSAKVQKTAAIALDQMDGQPLEKHHMAPFLQSKEQELRKTGIWLASHHPEWSDVITDFLKEHLNGDEFLESDIQDMENLLITFSADKKVQEFIAVELNDPGASLPKKLFLMKVIGLSTVAELPQPWVSSLGSLLRGGENEVRTAVLDLIESRNIPALEGELARIISDSGASAEIRLKALSARIMSQPALSDAEYRLVVDFLDPKFDSPVRQLAVRLLARADLGDSQLLEVAQELVPAADLFLLPSLVDAFQGNSNAEVGEALVNALKSADDRLDNLSEQDLQKLFASFPGSVQSQAEPLMTVLKERHADRLLKLEQMENSLAKGDVGEGRKLFFGKAACSTCHSVGPDGSKFGPDLTNIGEIRSRHDILEAIMYPDASFAREYETYKVVTKNNTYTGVIAEQLADAIVVTLGPAPGVRIPRADVISIEPHPVSMMPPGLDQQLSQEEMADLIAFMEALPYRIDRLIEARER
jgi:putative membrane-bound dehydrogenase-like protein